jgi:hypothetical protein
VMKTMGLIPDVLTSGEKFDSGPGSQRKPRTPFSPVNKTGDAGIRRLAIVLSAESNSQWCSRQ